MMSPDLQDKRKTTESVASIILTANDEKEQIHLAFLRSTTAIEEHRNSLKVV